MNSLPRSVYMLGGERTVAGRIGGTATVLPRGGETLLARWLGCCVGCL